MPIQEITIDDLPNRLKLIHVEQLYCRGNLPNFNQPTLAVVGTRRCSRAGIQTTHAIVRPIAQTGVIVVSGLAEGIDTAAHQATLDAGGITIAVLGTGVDNKTLYPQRNVPLANDIIEQGGAVVSEYPVGTPGRKHHFPKRNRIVAALADYILVVEAPAKSGALITADHARRLGKPLAAVPGAPNDPRTAGNNALLEQGAEAVASAERLADLLGIALTKTTTQPVAETDVEQEVMNLLSNKPQSVDKILEHCSVATPKVLAALSALEQRGAVTDIGGKRYILKEKLT